MTSPYPIRERIFVLQNEEALGPFDIEEILEGLEQGRFAIDDVCLREGAIETERLRDILDWDEDETPRRGTSPGGLATERTPVPLEDADEPVGAPEDVDAPGVDLAPGDVLYSGHPSILTYPSLLGLVGGLVAAAWLFPVDAGLSLVAFAVALLSLVHLSYIRFTRDYQITARRVEVISGLIARSSNEIRIADIRAINVSCRGLTGILGIGTVEFFTIGDKPEVVFRSVWTARAIKELVRDLQDRAV